MTLERHGSYKLSTLTTCQMGSLAGETCPPRLLSPWPQRILCIGFAVGRLLGRRGVAGLAVSSLFGSHVVVQIAPVLRRRRCIFGVWGGHNIPLRSAQALRPSTDCCCELVGAMGTARSALRAAVSSRLGVFPAKRFSQCVLGARVEAFQLRVLQCDHACAGCLNGRCRDTLAAPMAGNAGDPDSKGHSIRRTGMGQCGCNTEPGSMQSREHSRSTQNHV